MRSAQRPFQLLDPLLLLDIGLRGCASPPQRSLGSGFHFVFPTVIEIGSDLVFAARLRHVAALQNLQHNLPLLFRGSLDSRLSRHSRLLAEPPRLTNFRVQFYWGALQTTVVRKSSGRDAGSPSQNRKRSKLRVEKAAVFLDVPNPAWDSETTNHRLT